VKDIKTPQDLVSVQKLVDIGLNNARLTIQGGVDYDKILKGHRYG
jgi:hypothetical protein